MESIQSVAVGRGPEGLGGQRPDAHGREDPLHVLREGDLAVAAAAHEERAAPCPVASMALATARPASRVCRVSMRVSRGISNMIGWAGRSAILGTSAKRKIE